MEMGDQAEARTGSVPPTRLVPHAVRLRFGWRRVVVAFGRHPGAEARPGGASAATL